MNALTESIQVWRAFPNFMKRLKVSFEHELGGGICSMIVAQVTL